MLNIIVFGSHSGKNKGDLAILVSMVKNIRKRNKKTFIYIPSKDPSYLKNYFSKYPNVHIFKAKMGYLGFKTFKFMKESDVVIIGGGGLFFSRKIINPFYSHLLNLYILSIFNNLFYHKNKILFSVGASNLEDKLSRSMTAYILRNCNLISVRDISTRNLFSNLSQDNITLIYDPALDLSLKKSKIIDSIKLEKTKKNIIVCVNDSLFQIKPYNSTDNYEKFISSLKKLSDNYNIYLIQNDGKLSLIKKIKSDLNNKANLIEYTDLRPEEIIYLIKKFDLIISAPMHFSMFAYLAKAKIIQIAYDDKVLEFCNLINNKNITEINLLNKIPEIIKRYQPINYKSLLSIKKNIKEGYDILMKSISNGKLKR